MAQAQLLALTMCIMSALALSANGALDQSPGLHTNAESYTERVRGSSSHTSKQRKLLADAGGGIGAASVNTFPFCRCSNYTCGVSPYSLGIPTVTPATNGNSLICWPIQYTDCTPAQGTCCPLLKKSLHKIGFNVQASCTASVVSGSLNQGSVPVPVVFQTSPGATTGNLKLMPRAALNASSIGSAGTSSLCLLMAPPCNSLPQLCGNPQGQCGFYLSDPTSTCCPTCPGLWGLFPAESSSSPLPPPPSPGVSIPRIGPFPFCSCTARSPAISPYSLNRTQGLGSSTGRRQTLAAPADDPILGGTGGPVAPGTVGPSELTAQDSTATAATADGALGATAAAAAVPAAPGEILCFVVDAGTCNVANRCCSSDLYKVKFLIGNSCWGAVQYALVNGAQRSVTYATTIFNGQTYTSMALSNLGFGSPAAAAGSKVCFKLRDGALTKCSTGSSLCSSLPLPGYTSSMGCLYSMFNAGQDCCPTQMV